MAEYRGTSMSPSLFVEEFESESKYGRITTNNISANTMTADTPKKPIKEEARLDYSLHQKNNQRGNNYYESAYDLLSGSDREYIEPADPSETRHGASRGDFGTGFYSTSYSDHGGRFFEGKSKKGSRTQRTTGAQTVEARMPSLQSRAGRGPAIRNKDSQRSSQLVNRDGGIIRAYRNMEMEQAELELHDYRYSPEFGGLEMEREELVEPGAFRASNRQERPSLASMRFEDDTYDRQAREPTFSRSRSVALTDLPGHYYAPRARRVAGEKHRRNPARTANPGAENHQVLSQNNYENSGENAFNNFCRNMHESRYSDGGMTWRRNNPPTMVPSASVSDAALLKRGLKRGRDHLVCKRGYGASDPENILIVNLVETGRYKFEDIAEILNKNRIKAGKEPGLTGTGCHSRYNRTAPTLFKSEGKKFIPLAKRAKHAKKLAVEEEAEEEGMGHGALTGKPVMTPALDIVLIECYKEVESQKWFNVADLFKENTGVNMDATSAAVRYAAL